MRPIALLAPVCLFLVAQLTSVAELYLIASTHPAMALAVEVSVFVVWWFLLHDYVVKLVRGTRGKL